MFLDEIIAHASVISLVVTVSLACVVYLSSSPCSFVTLLAEHEPLHDYESLSLSLTDLIFYAHALHWLGVVYDDEHNVVAVIALCFFTDAAAAMVMTFVSALVKFYFSMNYAAYSAHWIVVLAEVKLMEIKLWMVWSATYAIYLHCCCYCRYHNLVSDYFGYNSVIFDLPDHCCSKGDLIAVIFIFIYLYLVNCLHAICYKICLPLVK